MMISKFWKALDELTDGGSSHWGWQQRLGEEWKAVAPFLPATGKMAASLPCPNPGGEGCPRQVVLNRDGTASAVCGDSPKSCKALDVSIDAIRVHALDARRFATALVAAFELSPPTRQPAPSLIMRLGTRERAAGLGVPVLLCVPGSTPRATPQDLDEILETPAPVVLLCPTTASLPDTVAEPLRRHGVTLIPLDVAVIARGPGKFALTPQGDVVMQGLLGQLDDMAAQSKGPQRAWDLPSGATWEKMTIRFTTEAVIAVTFADQTRRFEPEDIGMRNKKNGQPTSAWTHLLALAVNKGRLPLRHSNIHETHKYQRQMQTLTRSLQAAFGIETKPIISDGNEYVAQFVLSADDLRQGRQGQTLTKFR